MCLIDRCMCRKRTGGRTCSRHVAPSRLDVIGGKSIGVTAQSVPCRFSFTPLRFPLQSSCHAEFIACKSPTLLTCAFKGNRSLPRRRGRLHTLHEWHVKADARPAGKRAHMILIVEKNALEATPKEREENKKREQETKPAQDQFAVQRYGQAQPQTEKGRRKS